VYDRCKFFTRTHPPDRHHRSAYVCIWVRTYTHTHTNYIFICRFQTGFHWNATIVPHFTTNAAAHTLHDDSGSRYTVMLIFLSSLSYEKKKNHNNNNNNNNNRKNTFGRVEYNILDARVPNEISKKKKNAALLYSASWSLPCSWGTLTFDPLPLNRHRWAVWRDWFVLDRLCPQDWSAVVLQQAI
jgi:hypothetical protein